MTSPVEAPAGSERVAVVIGGTSGIGLATAHLLVEAGARVTVAGRNPEKGERAIRALGDGAHYVRADVASVEQVAAVIEATVQRWGRLDWAVNAAALPDDLRPVEVRFIAEA